MTSPGQLGTSSSHSDDRRPKPRLSKEDANGEELRSPEGLAKTFRELDAVR